MQDPLSKVLALPKSSRKVNMLMVHCSATKADQNVDVATIRKWHTDPEPHGRGWKDIGYHFVITRDGFVHLGRDTDGDGDVFEEVGAHTVGYNAHSLGVCMVGGINDNGQPEANFTKAQWTSLERLCRFIKADYPNITIHGHNEFAPKACPSFNVQTWLKTVNL